MWITRVEKFSKGDEAIRDERALPDIRMRNALPAFASAPTVKIANRTAHACVKLKPIGIVYTSPNTHHRIQIHEHAIVNNPSTLQIDVLKQTYGFRGRKEIDELSDREWDTECYGRRHE